MGDAAELKNFYNIQKVPNNPRSRRRKGKKVPRRKRSVLTANAPTIGGTTCSSTWSRTEDGRTPNASHNCSGKEQHPKKLQIIQTEAVKRKTS